MWLDHNLRISEEGVSIANYNLNDDIAKCYDEKVRNFKRARNFKGASLWKYPEKQYKLSDGDSAVNTSSAYVFSDFEESDYD